MELRRCYMMMFALSFVHISVAKVDICIYETCTCAGNSVNCENLTSIPPLVNGTWAKNITSIFLSAGGVTSVKDNSLPPNLETIYFVENPISQISPNAFLSSAKTLTGLTIKEAAFTTLPDALGKLQNLTYLGIFDTHIRDWNRPVLQSIGKTVKLLNLQNVSLTSWPDWIPLFPLLESLIVYWCPLTVIPDGALDNTVKTLKALSLIDANLSTVPIAISNLNLTSLSLSRNKLSNVKGIPKSEYIDLSFNMISDAVNLSNALNPSILRLDTLHLENNNLTVIPNLSHLINLDMLQLFDNQISDSNSGSLPQSLDTLFLSGNRLQSVPTVVANLTNLLTLSLSSNQITSFSASEIPQQLQDLRLNRNNITQLLASSFPVVSNLTHLYLQSNPIVSIHRSAFLPLKNLKVLNLDNTKLAQVPVALISLSSLEELSMQNISALNCSCPWDTSLVDWFTSGKLLSVSGTCSSGVKVKDFYDATECGVLKRALAPALSSSILGTCACLFLLFLICEFRV